MPKRFTWFVVGAAAGAGGAVAARRKVKQAVSAVTPAAMARRSVDTVRNVAANVADEISEAVADGRAVMRATEAELRARLHGESGAAAPFLEDLQVHEVIDVTESSDGRQRASVTRRVRRSRG